MTDDRHVNDQDFQAYLDQELDLGARAQMDAHMRRCPSCAGRLDQWKDMYSALRRLPDSRLPEDLVPLVMRRLQRDAARSSSLRWILAAEAAAVVALIAGRIPEITLAVLGAAGSLGDAIPRGLDSHLVDLTSRALASLHSAVSHFPTVSDLRTFFPDFGVSLMGWEVILLAAAIAWGAGSFLLLRGDRFRARGGHEGDAGD